MTLPSSPLDDYLDLIEQERERRPAEAMLADEIKLLRSVLVFADGFVVSQTINDEHPMALADLYNETCDAAGAIQRAGCHPRGRFRRNVHRSHPCCERNLPGISFTRPDGTEYECPECGCRWIWTEDEAEGGEWIYDQEQDRE